jgi:SP family general alpha glucoside:H+ symporter-like MFS transporter
LILILQVIFLIETPYFLLLSGKSKQAERNMRKLYPGRTEEQYAVQFAEYEYILLKESEKKELEAGSTFWDCLKGTDGRRTFCAVLPQMSQSFCGQSLISTQVGVLDTVLTTKSSLTLC